MIRGLDLLGRISGLNDEHGIPRPSLEAAKESFQTKRPRASRAGNLTKAQPEVFQAWCVVGGLAEFGPELSYFLEFSVRVGLNIS